MVQSGVISANKMKRMIVLFTTMASISGVSLLLVSHLAMFSVSFFVLLILGILAIWAALTYTIGNNPYGYSGWGDLSVFLFFGLLSVMGTYYLYAGEITPDVFLPAISIGALSVGVLNINNMRDHDNDKAAGKNTVVVKIGEGATMLWTLHRSSCLITNGKKARQTSTKDSWLGKYSQ